MVKYNTKQVYFGGVHIVLDEYQKRPSGKFELPSDGFVTDTDTVDVTRWWEQYQNLVFYFQPCGFVLS